MERARWQPGVRWVSGYLVFLRHTHKGLFHKLAPSENLYITQRSHTLGKPQHESSKSPCIWLPYTVPFCILTLVMTQCFGYLINQSIDRSISVLTSFLRTAGIKREEGRTCCLIHTNESNICIFTQLHLAVESCLEDLKTWVLFFCGAISPDLGFVFSVIPVKSHKCLWSMSTSMCIVVCGGTED